MELYRIHLDSFTQHSYFEIYPCCCTNHFFHFTAKFYCMTTSQLVYYFTCWCIFGLFSILFILNYLCHAKPWQVRLHYKFIYKCIPHAPHQAECGHNQSLAWVPTCLPSSRGSCLSSSTVLWLWREGLKDAQGHSWLSRVSWCQGGSLKESVSTLSEVEGRVSHPPLQLWTKKGCRAQGHSQSVCSQPPTCPLQLSGSRTPRTSPSRQTSHYKAFSAAPPPHYQTHVCTQGSSTPCPSTGGRAASATRAQCFVCFV